MQSLADVSAPTFSAVPSPSLVATLQGRNSYSQSSVDWPSSAVTKVPKGLLKTIQELLRDFARPFQVLSEKNLDVFNDSTYKFQ